jgi:hypothetical protein
MRIATVCNYRTGSCAFSVMKSMQYGVPWLGHLFHSSRPFPIGGVNRVWQPQEPLPGMNLKDEGDQVILDALKNGEPGSFIVKPGQLDQRHWEELFDNVDLVYYLYRRNFPATVRSQVIAELKSDFGTGWYVPEEIKKGDDKQLLARYQHLGVWSHSTPQKQVSNPTQEFVHDQAALLIREYMRMYDCYKRYPGELVAFEDYFTGELYNPYNRYVTMDYDYTVPNFYPSQLFDHDDVSMLGQDQWRQNL